MAFMAKNGSLTTLKAVCWLLGAIFVVAAMVEGAFMLLAFFAFLRLGVFATCAFGELKRVSPPQHSSLILIGIITGTSVVVAISALAIAGIYVLNRFVFESSQDAEDVFNMFWYTLSAVVATYLAVSIVRLIALRDVLRIQAAEIITDVRKGTSNMRLRRRALFGAAVKIVLRDGARASLFFLVLGWTDLAAIPLAALLGLAAGFFGASAIARPAKNDVLQSFAALDPAGGASVDGAGGMTKSRSRADTATVAVAAAAAAAGGVISEEAEARTVSASWELRRSQLFEALPTEQQEEVAAVVRTRSRSRLGSGGAFGSNGGGDFQLGLGREDSKLDGEADCSQRAPVATTAVTAAAAPAPPAGAAPAPAAIRALTATATGDDTASSLSDSEQPPAGGDVGAARVTSSDFIGRTLSSLPLPTIAEDGSTTEEEDMTKWAELLERASSKRALSSKYPSSGGGGSGPAAKFGSDGGVPPTIAESAEGGEEPSGSHSESLASMEKDAVEAADEKDGEAGTGRRPVAAAVLSAVVLMVIAAGFAGTAMEALNDLADISPKTLWDACSENADGHGKDALDSLVRVLQEQFSYQCAPTGPFAYAWLAYWVWGSLFFFYKLRLGCFSGVSGGGLEGRDRAAMAAGPQRRRGGKDGEGSDEEEGDAPLFEGTPDPWRIDLHPTAKYIVVLALLNFAAGGAYMWWRVARSMVDLALPVWSWIFFGGECVLMCGVFFSHASRMFPSERDYCTMEHLVSIDPTVGAKGTVAILVPTAGEKMKALKQVIVGAYSQRLWASTEPASRQLRICVLDEKARPEVLKMVEVVYELAGVLAEPVMQKDLAFRLNEHVVTPKVWMDTFATFTGLDRIFFGEEHARLFDLSTELDKMAPNTERRDDVLERRNSNNEYWHRQQENKKERKAAKKAAAAAEKAAAERAAALAAGDLDAAAAAAAAAPVEKKATPKLEAGTRKVLDGNQAIPSIAYYTRTDPGRPKISPKAGNMNAAIFATGPGIAPIIGDAKIIMVNDARHRIKSECLQRTVPYFFKLFTATQASDAVRAATAASGGGTAAAAAAAASVGPVCDRYEWADVAYVQLPQRFADLGDGDPLGNHAVLTFYVANVAKDGVGAVTSCGQGSLWRVDALSGFTAKMQQTIPDPVENRELIGHKCGFRAEVLIEDTHTSLSLFRLGWRSAYVCEPDEALAICVDPPDTVAWRVKQVFRWHLGAVQLFLKDHLKFALAWSMPSPLHRIIAFDSVTYYFQALGGILIVLMPIIFCITQTTPFDTRGLEFIYFFFPYIITATLPTTLSISWKGVHPDRVLTDEQFWISTCYVQLWALFTGVKDWITRADPDNAWNSKCPTWPLPLTFFTLVGCCIYTTVHWIYFGCPMAKVFVWFASLGACLIVLHSMWPMFLLWASAQTKWRFKCPSCSCPTAYTRKTVLVLLFIAGSGLLVAFAVN